MNKELNIYNNNVVSLLLKDKDVIDKVYARSKIKPFTTMAESYRYGEELKNAKSFNKTTS